METPEVAGLHHIQFPVSDLNASITWFERVLGASIIISTATHSCECAA